MSLVILSNTQEEYDIDELVKDTSSAVEEQQGAADVVFVKQAVSRATGLTRPYSFQNHFSNVFKIPANSEVAVQSIKINRNALADVRDKSLMIYFGESITTAMNGGTTYDHGTSVPINCPLIDGYYSIEELARELTRALEEGFGSYPQMNGHASVVPHFVSGVFSGYSITITGDDGEISNQITNMGVDASGANKQMIGWRPCHEITDNGNFSQATIGGQNVLTCVSNLGGDMSCLVQNGNKPLKASGGVWEFDCFEYSTDGTSAWSVGLSRPKTPDCPHPEWSNEYIHDEYQTFFDYVLVWDTNEDSAGKMRLRIYHAVWNTDDSHGGEGLSMEEVVYYGTGQKGSDLYGQELGEGNVNPSGTEDALSKFRFKLTGEHLTLEAKINVYGGGGDAWIKLVDGDTYKTLDGGYDTAFAAVGQNKWGLFPTIGLEVVNDKIVTAVYNSVEDWGIFPDDQGLYKAGEYINPTEGDGGTLFYGKSMYDTTGIKARLARAADALTTNHDGRMGSRVTIKLDANGDMVNYVKAILPQNNGNDFTTRRKGIYSTLRGTNCGGLLGFPYRTAVASDALGTTTDSKGNAVAAGNGLKWIVTSQAVPTLSTHSAFVRINDLTHQSLNMCKGLPSKILYHIPRFSNSGQEYGNLFFECAEKTYLKLNNSEELNLNMLNVDIVDKEEKYAKDLQGATTLVLHFRPHRL